jgi:hypothetical protein
LPGALFGILAVLLGVSGPARAQGDAALLDRVGEIPGLVERGAVDPAQIPNPHWRADACKACHTSAPALREANVIRLCNQCHDAVFDHSCIHPVGARVGEAMLARMPGSYRDAVRGSGGRMSCTTCHDVPAQCLSERRREQARNPMFFRGGPFRLRTEQCYFCHELEKYPRLNPHRQRSADGQVREAICRLCHSEKIEALQAAKSIDDTRLSRLGDLNRLCTRCHTWTPHPGTALDFGKKKPVADHLVKPSAEMASHMQRQAASTGIILPVAPKTGRIFCGTCHDPHEPGVVTNPGASAQADTKARLRAREMCVHCHEV